MLNKSASSMQPRQTKLPRGGVTTDDPMSRDLLSPGAFWYYYKYHTASGKNVENKKLISISTVPRINLFHQSFYKDVNSADRRKLSSQIFGTGKQIFVNPGYSDKKTFSLKAPTTDLDDACTISPKNCANNMAGYTFTLKRIAKDAPLSYAKQGVDPIPGFYDVSYLEDKKDPGFEEGFGDDDKACSNIDLCTTDASALKYIVYYPTLIDYTDCTLPGILLFHAGGYSDCSNYKYEDSLCYALARKGFIVYNIEYRRGRIKDSKDGGIYTSAQQMLALYRAFQDGRGAIRSIIKRQRDIITYPLPYQVDTTKLFVAGQSAGASIANTLAYYNTQAKINAIFPVPTGETSIQSALGNIDADFYYGTPDIEYQSKIKGLWSMWGGFAIPTVAGVAVDEYNFLSADLDEVVPMIGVMGRYDPVFPLPLANQYVYYPPKNDNRHNKFTKETSCILTNSFKVYKNLDEVAFRVECVDNIYLMLKAHNIASLEYFDCYMGHGLAHVCGQCICSTDFGESASITLNQVNEYLASRASFFFQSILTGNANSLDGATRFKSCLDMRDGNGTCATAHVNDNCGDNKACPPPPPNEQ